MTEEMTDPDDGIEAPAGPRLGWPDWAWATLLSAAIIGLMLIVGWPTFT
ncbi:MAG: hypothetical protein OXC54_10515 [Rhodospirillaceae bacterium]|nr:hypothetical protein [Rhodospirillaceae bacterium]MCY4311720.1 hypothetical protein [Rhodospirillaceae bacterium]